MLGQLQLPGASGVELYPAHLQQQIDALNDKVGGLRRLVHHTGSIVGCLTPGQLLLLYVTCAIRYTAEEHTQSTADCSQLATLRLPCLVDHMLS
jgi:hypothetical protein